MLLSAAGYPCETEECSFQGKTWTEYLKHRKKHKGMSVVQGRTSHHIVLFRQAACVHIYYTECLGLLCLQGSCRAESAKSNLTTPGSCISMSCVSTLGKRGCCHVPEKDVIKSSRVASTWRVTYWETTRARSPLAAPMMAVGRALP